MKGVNTKYLFVVKLKMVEKEICKWILKQERNMK